MARKVVRVDDLVGPAEIADRLDVQADTVWQWHGRHASFPEPVVRLKGATLWVWPDVEKWAKATGRLR